MSVLSSHSSCLINLSKQPERKKNTTFYPPPHLLLLEIRNQNRCGGWKAARKGPLADKKRGIKKEKRAAFIPRAVTCEYRWRQVVQVEARPVEVEDVFKCFQGLVDVGFQLAWTHRTNSKLFFSFPAGPKIPVVIGACGKISGRAH